MSQRVLFICSGNICRSPFAEGYFRKLVDEVGLKGTTATSAGTLGLRDRPASDHAIRVGAEHGTALKAHRSRALHRGLLRTADHALVMEQAHRRHIESSWPEEADKVRLLRTFERADGRGPQRDILDPIGLSPEEYRHCFDVIARCLVNFAFWLKHPE